MQMVSASVVCLSFDVMCIGFGQPITGVHRSKILSAAPPLGRVLIGSTVNGITLRPPRTTTVYPHCPAHVQSSFLTSGHMLVEACWHVTSSPVHGIPSAHTFLVALCNSHLNISRAEQFACIYHCIEAAWKILKANFEHSRMGESRLIHIMKASNGSRMPIPAPATLLTEP